MLKYAQAPVYFGEPFELIYFEFSATNTPAEIACSQPVFAGSKPCVCGSPYFIAGVAHHQSLPFVTSGESKR